MRPLRVLVFASRDPDAPLDELLHRALAALGEDGYGTDDTTLVDVAQRSVATSGLRSLATAEFGARGALISVLAESWPSGGPRLVGGTVHHGPSQGWSPQVGDHPADATLILRLDEEEATGRGRCAVRLEGAVAFPEHHFRVHGVGPQLRRRAAFGALDLLRRILPSR